MNDLFPMALEILLRATWVLGGALLIAGLLRRRPLVASSLLASTSVGLLALPVITALLPHVSIPVWPQEAAARRLETRRAQNGAPQGNPQSLDNSSPAPGARIPLRESLDAAPAAPS